MKYDLIFGGISDANFETEDTEAVLRHFLHTELDVSNVGASNLRTFTVLVPAETENLETS